MPLQGLLHLHSRGLVHRDVKTPNLLVDAGWQCKASAAAKAHTACIGLLADEHCLYNFVVLVRVQVGDYNLSRIYQETCTGGSSTTAAMNPRWLSPEVMQASCSRGC